MCDPLLEEPVLDHAWILVLARGRSVRRHGGPRRFRHRGPLLLELLGRAAGVCRQPRREELALHDLRIDVETLAAVVLVARHEANRSAARADSLGCARAP